MSKRRQQRAQQTQNFYKSLQLLQAGKMLCDEVDENTPFEDYSIYMYRQNAPEFKDRVKDLEKKLLFPVRHCVCTRVTMTCCVLWSVVYPSQKTLIKRFLTISVFLSTLSPNNLASTQFANQLQLIAKNQIIISSSIKCIILFTFCSITMPRLAVRNRLY